MLERDKKVVHQARREVWTQSNAHSPREAFTLLLAPCSPISGFSRPVPEHTGGSSLPVCCRSSTLGSQSPPYSGEELPSLSEVQRPSPQKKSRLDSLLAKALERHARTTDVLMPDTQSLTCVVPSDAHT